MRQTERNGTQMHRDVLAEWALRLGVDMTLFSSLTAAGFAATAIAFGPARMGFGLFVPELRAEFSMSSSAVGVISSFGFFGFFTGLLIAQAMLDRRGPGLPVLTGLAAATAGLATVALAPNLFILAVGVFIAASSAGLSWTPFNNAVHINVKDEDRPIALSVVSTGTGVGIALAGAAALFMVSTDLTWRVCWAMFATASAIGLLSNRAAFRSVDREAGGGARGGWRALLHIRAVPLYAIGFAYGSTSAIYISFAADHIATVAALPGVSGAALPAFVYMFYGLFGLSGVLTARACARVGLPMFLRLLMLSGAVSTALVALAPDTWAGLTISAGLQGAHVLMTSAVLSFWSERLFPSLPSLSFTAALLAAASGSVLGPAVAGVVSDYFGPTPMFLGAAAVPFITSLLLRDRHAMQRLT